MKRAAVVTVVLQPRQERWSARRIPPTKNATIEETLLLVLIELPRTMF